MTSTHFSLKTQIICWETYYLKQTKATLIFEYPVDSSDFLHRKIEICQRNKGTVLCKQTPTKLSVKTSASPRTKNLLK